MKIDGAQLLDKQNTTPVLPQNSSNVRILYIERKDTLQEVFQILRHHELPVLLVLPDHGTVLSQRGHFLSLSHFVREEGPPFFHLVIPPQRIQEMAFAVQYGFQWSSSLEDALQALVHHYQSLSQLEDNVFGGIKSASREASQALREGAEPWKTMSPPIPRLAREKHPSVFVIGLLSTLVVASMLLLPLVLIPPTQSHPSGQISTTFGTVTFSSSGQVDPLSSRGLNDIITVTLHALTPPKVGDSYYAWMMPDPGDDGTRPLLLGILSVNGGNTQLTYTDPQHLDLLVHFSGFRITEQSSNDVPTTPSQDPKMWRYEGWIPTIPTPGDEKGYSLLSHLRHLIASDPTVAALGLAGGLDTWLTRNSEKLIEYSSSARDSWAGEKTMVDAADLMHRHVIRVLDYLDGQAYAWQDVPRGVPWLIDPLAGHIGLLDFTPNQNPPGYIAHVDIHLTGLAHAPGHTNNQMTQAISINHALSTVTRSLKQMRQDALHLVNLNDTQMQQPQALSWLNDMVTQATIAFDGQFDPSVGGNTGGITWIHAQLQRLAIISVVASHP